MDGLRVCILTTSFPRYRDDPSAPFIYKLAKKLVDNGVKVNVVAPHDLETQGFEIIDGIKVYRFRYMFPKRLQRIAYHGGVPSNLRNSLIAKLELPLFMFSFFLKSFKISSKCDVIHAHWTLSGLLGIFLKKIQGKAVVLTVHGSDINIIPQGGLLKKLSVYTLKNTDRIIAVSNALKNRIIGFGVSTKRVKVIPNAVNVSDFPFIYKKTNEFKILFIGRLTPEKGLEYLIESMKEVTKEIPQATLTIVGDGPLRKELERLSEEKTVQDKIMFEGLQPYSKMSRYIQGTDLFVLPSLSEGLPLVLLEAMACGKPVVATTVGGIPDVMADEETGILIPPKDSVALSGAIISLLRNRVEDRRAGIKAREIIEREFTWDKVADETINVYRSLKSEQA